jgi:hypothetical protein
MADLIRFVLTNLPAMLFIAALVIPTVWRKGPVGTRYLSWLLLLSVGVEMIWAGIFHVLFPETAAQQIGWQVSPFQFEIGVADIAIGMVAVVAFRRSLQFRTAVVLYVVLFYIGVAFGHVRQALVAGNYSPDNFGLLLLLTVVKIVLLSWLLWKSGQEAKAAAW